MSRVFLAEETALGRKVVIKVLPSELAAEVNAERFRREIQLAAKLQHPYIVPVLSTGIAGGLPYFTMPYVEGESLRARLQKSGEFPVPEAVGIMRDVLEALAYAHECSVVHRDIKPENVLLARHHAHVADFGVAKALSASTNAQSGLTSLGVALGTPAYMSPEQAMADPSTDHRADLYAVGAMGYEMLTGYQVFSARSPQAMLAAHATEAPEIVEKRRPNTPPALAALIMRLLEKHPADRPQSAEEALGILAQVATPSGGMAPTFQQVVASPSAPAMRRRRILIAGALALAAVLGIGGYTITHRRAAASTAAGESGHPSIAVLPFENMSGDPQNDYLGDGLSEELIGGLSRVRGLQVAARTSSFAFKGKSEDVRSIGSKLGVGSVLGGSVRKSGNKLRVSVQLTNVSTGYNLWSETYDREMRDVFAVEDEISHAIVKALEIRLTGAQPSGQIVQQGTSDPVAYDLYLKGRYAWNQRGAALFTAEKLFKQAIARDSGFALAWSGLADVYGTMTSWGFMEPRKAAALAVPYARRAVALAPSLPEPHVSLGFEECHLLGRQEAGLSEFQKALEINPSLGVAHYFKSLCLVLAGRPRDAIAEGLEAQRLEPLNAQFATATARAYIAAGEPRKAIDVANRAVQMTPQLGSSYGSLMWAYAALGDTAGIRKAADASASRNPSNSVGIKAFVAIVTHNPAALRQQTSGIRDNTGVVAIYVAGAYAIVHQADSAFVWLDRAYERQSDVMGVVQYPIFDGLRKDPRFIAFRKKYNIPTPQL